MCNKAKHKSIAAAMAEIKKSNCRYEMHIYKCHRCGCYHIGKTYFGRGEHLIDLINSVA